MKKKIGDILLSLLLFALGAKMYKKLFVYADADHKHEAQKPEVLEVK